MVGKDSFHRQLSQVRDRLFRDEKFTALHCLDNERPLVPPSLLAAALLLQVHDKVSDAEAHRRARLNLGWKVALGVKVDAKPFAQSTLQPFRSQLILHDQLQAVFLRSLELAREKGLLKGPALRLVLDTTPLAGVMLAELLVRLSELLFHMDARRMVDEVHQRDSVLICYRPHPVSGSRQRQKDMAFPEQRRSVDRIWAVRGPSPSFFQRGRCRLRTRYNVQMLQSSRTEPM